MTLTRPLAQLPINVRPRLGETTVHYVQRLARANHLKSSYLLRILTGPAATRTLHVKLERLAALSGRPADILKVTLADAGPTLIPVHTAASLRLERFASQKSRHHSSNLIGQIKRDARRSKGTLRQLAAKWMLPRWLIKKILSPDFPDRRPVGRSLISEELHSRLRACYEQGLTPAQTWTDLVDNHDLDVPEGSIRHRFAPFDLERGVARLSETE
ncbi:hypothetical protein [Streptomyces sp. NPDC088146]|uniref:hypothetical protein n=1 Tax=Streptomyces sp. NPDC088146 TaxID=3365829 RepID=UPI003815F40A